MSIRRAAKRRWSSAIAKKETGDHLHSSCGETKVVPCLFFCNGRDHLEQLVGETGAMKFFAGMAGWGAGQLEGELAEGAWLTLPAKVQDVFSDDPTIWEQVMRQASGARVVDMLK